MTAQATAATTRPHLDDMLFGSGDVPAAIRSLAPRNSETRCEFCGNHGHDGTMCRDKITNGGR